MREERARGREGGSGKGGKGERGEERKGEKIHTLSEHIPHKRVQLTYPHILTWIKSFLLTRVGSAIRSWWRVSMSA